MLSVPRLTRSMVVLAAVSALAVLSSPTIPGQAAPLGQEACDERGNPVSGGRYQCITFQTDQQAVAAGGETTLSYNCGGAYAVVDHAINFRGAPFSVTSHNWDDGQSVPTVTVKNIGSGEGTVSLSGRCVTRQPA